MDSRRIQKASDGLSYSRGGLNKDDIKKYLLSQGFSVKELLISRKELNKKIKQVLKRQMSQVAELKQPIQKNTITQDVLPSDVIGLVLENLTPGEILSRYQNEQLELNKRQILNLLNVLEFIDPQYIIIQSSSIDYWHDMGDETRDVLMNEILEYDPEGKILFTNDVKKNVRLYEYGEIEESEQEKLYEAFIEKYGNEYAEVFGEFSLEGEEEWYYQKQKELGQFDIKTKQETESVIEILKENNLFIDNIVVIRGNNNLYNSLLHPIMQHNYIGKYYWYLRGGHIGNTMLQYTAKELYQNKILNKKQIVTADTNILFVQYEKSF